MSSPAQTNEESLPTERPALTCRLCGQVHRLPPLLRGQRASCVRCGTLLARRGWLGQDAALAFAVTGAALAVPACTLPFISVAKLGREHTGYLLTGATTLWESGMRLLAIWVVLCGALAPIVLLLTLTGVLGRARAVYERIGARYWQGLAHAVEHWAMPEVHVLAVLVALIKLGDLVDVHIGAGFWCYVAMSIALLLAWRTYNVETSAPVRRARSAQHFA